LTRSENLAVSSQAHSKIAKKYLKLWSSWQNFPSYIKSGTANLNLGLDFELVVVLCVLEGKTIHSGSAEGSVPIQHTVMEIETEYSVNLGLGHSGDRH